MTQTGATAAATWERGFMSLKGKRVLVLQSEYLVALDVQALLEKRGAIVSIDEPQSDGPSEFDAVVVDYIWASQPIAARLFAAGVHLIGYTRATSRRSRRSSPAAWSSTNPRQPTP